MPRIAFVLHRVLGATRSTANAACDPTPHPPAPAPLLVYPSAWMAGHISSLHFAETQGSEKKRALWDLFCSWDADSNGYLDWNELQKVVADVGALDNKRARWLPPAALHQS